MPARLPPNRTVNSRAVLAKMERWSRAALARLAKQAEHTDRSGATQTVFHSTASSLPIPFVICRLLLTASSGAKYDEKSGLDLRKSHGGETTGHLHADARPCRCGRADQRGGTPSLPLLADR